MNKIFKVGLYLFVAGISSNLFAELGMEFSPFLTLNDMTDKSQKRPELTQLYDWHEQPSLFKLYLDLEEGNLHAYTHMDLHTDLMADIHHQTWSNLPYMGSEGVYADPNIPDIGYVEWESDSVLLSGGRRKLHIGPGDYALGLAGSSPYFDHVLFQKTFPGEKSHWQYSFTAITADRKAMEKLADTEYKTLFTHRLSWQTEKLILAVTEYNLIYEQVPTLQDAGFIVFYHGMYQDYQNVMDEISFEFLPRENFRVFGSLVSDDYQMSIESEDSKPGAMGVAGGLSWKVFDAAPLENPFQDSTTHMWKTDRLADFDGGLILSAECMWASKYLYNREVESGKFTNPMYYSWEYERETVNTFYGALYGPDTITGKLTAQWNSDPWRVKVSGELLAAGAEGIDINYEPPYENWVTMKDPVSYTFMFDVEVEWALSEDVRFFAATGLDFGEDDIGYNLELGYRRILF